MKKEYGIIALASRVLAVAVCNMQEGKEKGLFDWAVYIDAVPGINHDIEFMDVARLGDKQSKEIAKFLFPGIDINKYRS
jgi:hypothetical protein